jgi:hypothetical protein
VRATTEIVGSIDSAGRCIVDMAGQGIVEAIEGDKVDSHDIVFVDMAVRKQEQSTGRRRCMEDTAHHNVAAQLRAPKAYQSSEAEQMIPGWF